MSEMGIRQLRADAAASVRRAASGEHIVISIGGRPIAQWVRLVRRKVKLDSAI